MRRWEGLDEIPADLGPTVASVGVFDGVHRGHAAVVAAAVNLAHELGAAPVVVTFDPHPVEVLRPGLHVPRLATLPRRLELLADLGVSGTLVLTFTAEMSAEPPEEFVRDVLVGALRARAVVVGADFRFGHRAAGDVALLERLGSGSGFAVQAISPLGDGERWSSTRVRQELVEGRVEEAAAVLGRPHRLEGTVVRGEQRGRQLGYPTANLAVSAELLVPADGVYAGWLIHAGESLPAAVSIGTNPTFEGSDRTVEAYVLDRDDLELYGAEVALDLHARLRGMERFAGVAQLQAAMARDVEQARLLLS